MTSFARLAPKKNAYIYVDEIYNKIRNDPRVIALKAQDNMDNAKIAHAKLIQLTSEGRTWTDTEWKKNGKMLTVTLPTSVLSFKRCSTTVELLLESKSTTRLTTIS